jgi:hypothetical protein
MPPLSMADEDRITKEEAELHWPRIQQRMLGLSDSRGLDPSVPGRMMSVKSAHLSGLAEVYPPRLSSPWWLPPVASSGIGSGSSSRPAIYSAMRKEQTLYDTLLILEHIYQKKRGDSPGTEHRPSA